MIPTFMETTKKLISQAILFLIKMDVLTAVDYLKKNFFVGWKSLHNKCLTSEKMNMTK